MATEEVIDAVEEILREEGVLDEIKKNLFLAVSSVVKKQKPVVVKTKAKEFVNTINGQCSLELIIDLLEKLELNHSLEILKLESGFNPDTGLGKNLLEKFDGKLSSDTPFLLQIVDGTAGNIGTSKTINSVEHKQSAECEEKQSPPIKEALVAPVKKNRSPLAQHGTPPVDHKSSIDLESSYEADDKSTSSMDRRHFSPKKDKNKKKKNAVSPLGPSPSKKSTLSPLEKKDLPPLGSLEPLGQPRRSSLDKLHSGSNKLSGGELTLESVSTSKIKLDHLEDSFDHSIEDKLEESKDRYEISSSFEHSDVNMKFDLPPAKNHLTPLTDVSMSSKSENDKSVLEESLPEELTSASFLEESVLSEKSYEKSPDKLDDGSGSKAMDSPKKSEFSPSSGSLNVKLVDENVNPATEDDDDGNPAHVNVSNASTVRMLRSQVGWNDDEDKGRQDDDYIFAEKKESSGQVIPGRSNNNANSSPDQDGPDINEYDNNSDFGSIQDIEDAVDDSAIYDDDKVDLNASYRSNQEEDEEENARLNARDGLTDNEATGSLFVSSTISKDKEESLTGSPKNKAADETDDYDDDYGDDFDDDFENDDDEVVEELDESIAESLDEEFAYENSVSFGANDSDSDKDKSYMSSPTQSPNSKLPSLFTKTKSPDIKAEKVGNDSMDSDPFQDKSGSFDEGGPETSLVSKDDLEDFSVGSASSDGDEFLKDEDDESASANELSAKEQRSTGRLGESNDFSMSEQEISGSHNLNEISVDYTTSAVPPASRRGGW